MQTKINDSARVSNTLAQNTHPNSMRVLVDWVSASFEAEKKIEEIFQLFGVYEMEIIKDGKKEMQLIEYTVEEYSRYHKQGYKQTYRYGHMEFHHDPDNNKFLISLSGQGCREFETISNLDYEQLFSMLIVYFNATFNRIDIAIDDFNSIYKVNTIRKAVLNDQAKTKIKTWGSHTRGKIGQPGLTMDNFYLGDITSRYSINIYDKKLEREDKLEKLKDGQVLLDNPDVKSWTRTEVRLKTDYALQFAREIAINDGKPLGILIKAFLNESICFLKKKVKDGNKSRLAKDSSNYAHWWKKFLGDVGKLKLSQRAPDKSVVKAVKWFNRSIAPTIAMFNDLSPESLFLLIQALKMEGKERLSDDHKNMVKVAKDSDLNILDILKEYVSEDTYQNLMDMDRRIKNKKKVVLMDQFKNKEDYKEKLLDEYWNQVSDQQKRIFNAEDSQVQSN